MGKRRSSRGLFDATDVFKPLAMYQMLLQTLHNTNCESTMSARVPPSLIDFTAVLAASLVTRNADVVVTNFVKRILHRSDLSCSSLLLAMCYLDHLKALITVDVCIGEEDDHPECALFIVAVMVADKYADDIAYSNTFWASINGRYSLERLNAMERRFLDLLNYDLFVSDIKYDAFLSKLETSLCLGQALDKPSFTCADLCVLATSFSSIDRLHTPQTKTVQQELSTNLATVAFNFALPDQAIALVTRTLAYLLGMYTTALVVLYVIARFIAMVFAQRAVTNLILSGALALHHPSVSNDVFKFTAPS